MKIEEKRANYADSTDREEEVKTILVETHFNASQKRGKHEAGLPVRRTQREIKKFTADERDEKDIRSVM